MGGAESSTKTLINFRQTALELESKLKLKARRLPTKNIIHLSQPWQNFPSSRRHVVIRREGKRKQKRETSLVWRILVERWIVDLPGNDLVKTVLFVFRQEVTASVSLGRSWRPKSKLESSHVWPWRARTIEER